MAHSPITPITLGSLIMPDLSTCFAADVTGPSRSGRFRPQRFLPWFIVTLQFASVASAQTSGLNVTTDDEGVWVRDRHGPVLYYRRTPKSVNGAPPRAHYIHPLFDLDGNELTEDAPRDHPHHHGVFWAWHRLLVGGKPIGDPWTVVDFQCDVRQLTVGRVELLADQSVVSLDLVVEWTSPLWTKRGAQQPIVEEHTTIRIHPVVDNARRLDFDITLKALEDEIQLGGSNDQKGYGGFSVRVRLPDAVRFLGLDGNIEPQVVGIAAGPVVAVTADFGSTRPSGIAILQHPTLPGFPQPWILRNRGSMQNAAYPGREPVRLPRGHPWRLRYRLIVYRGACDAEQLQTWVGEYE